MRQAERGWCRYPRRDPAPAAAAAAAATTTEDYEKMAACHVCMWARGLWCGACLRQIVELARHHRTASRVTLGAQRRCARSAQLAHRGPGGSGWLQSEGRVVVRVHVLEAGIL